MRLQSARPLSQIRFGESGEVQDTRLNLACSSGGFWPKSARLAVGMAWRELRAPQRGKPAVNRASKGQVKQPERF